ncbi:thioredoxin family protein [uncultured Oxalicibacterium sp.]|uniref:thioredoxin family protein n=1 Tax=uncultured Oxalicibacterium sp. TaxID=1168540 RepID=UPI0025E07D38|nr:thioredoxin family protein [uncultured Oxalicibacterium sp.]
MPSLVLEENNRAALVAQMTDDTWVVACLCAAWCDVCTAYRPEFEALAANYPDTLFVWIDIEDRADMVGDFDVENFPTILIQRADEVVFYGTTLPDPRIALRLLAAQAQRDPAERVATASGNPDYQLWQEERNLRKALKS